VLIICAAASLASISKRLFLITLLALPSAFPVHSSSCSFLSSKLSYDFMLHIRSGKGGSEDMVKKTLNALEGGPPLNIYIIAYVIAE